MSKKVGNDGDYDLFKASVRYGETDSLSLEDSLKQNEQVTYTSTPAFWDYCNTIVTKEKKLVKKVEMVVRNSDGDEVQRVEKDLQYSSGTQVAYMRKQFSNCTTPSATIRFYNPSDLPENEDIELPENADITGLERIRVVIVE